MTGSHAPTVVHPCTARRPPAGSGTWRRLRCTRSSCRCQPLAASSSRTAAAPAPTPRPHRPPHSSSWGSLRGAKLASSLASGHRPPLQVHHSMGQPLPQRPSPSAVSSLSPGKHISPSSSSSSSMCTGSLPWGPCACPLQARPMRRRPRPACSHALPPPRLAVPGPRRLPP